MTMTNPMRRALVAVAIGAATYLAVPVGDANAAKMRVAFGDVAAIESIHFLAAFERAKERGVEVEVTYLQAEDVAAQAVVGGQMDIGIGGPYALIQKVKAPIRIFAQLSVLRFFPVVNSEVYKTWEDLDGQPIAVHARGSGTEAIMQLMADVKGIEYSEVSYIPGSEVRAGALLQGTVNASIVDAANRRFLENEAPGKFIFLALDEVAASDEVLFANTDYLSANAGDVDILVEELLKSIREVADDPAKAVEMRNKYSLLPDLGAEADEDILAYFKETAEAGALPVNGGGVAAAEDDFAFYALAGQLEGDAASLNVADFWELGPLERVLGQLGER
jgi:NitT/TauT family transport system substrate-binding protein